LTGRITVRARYYPWIEGGLLKKTTGKSKEKAGQMTGNRHLESEVKAENRRAISVKLWMQCAGS
jgi:hypothetical protein